VEGRRWKVEGGRYRELGIAKKREDWIKKHGFIRASLFFY
jgi:hypothetical protein